MRCSAVEGPVLDPTSRHRAVFSDLIILSDPSSAARGTRPPQPASRPTALTGYPRCPGTHLNRFWASGSALSLSITTQRKHPSAAGAGARSRRSSASLRKSLEQSQELRQLRLMPQLRPLQKLRLSSRKLAQSVTGRTIIGVVGVLVGRTRRSTQARGGGGRGSTRPRRPRF